MTVPLFDGAREFEAHAGEYLAVAGSVLRSGHYILGPEVAAFEQEVADYVGVRHAVGCASGTDALWLALKAAGVGPGDGVIAPAFTFFATASAILNTGATPVLCDIDPLTFNIDPKAVRKVLEQASDVHRRAGVDTKRIKAVVPVHLFGQPADMQELKGLATEHGLRVVEDAAQAFGSSYGERRAGALGDLGCFSFFPTKNLGGFGDGGMVTTSDDELATRLRMLRNHGGGNKYSNEMVGTNSRLDALQAAMLRKRLGHIDEALAARRQAAGLYDSLLAESGARLPARAPGREHSFNLYVVRLEQRDRVREALSGEGIETAVHYPSPVHLQPAIGAGYREGDFPAAEEACAEVLTLPTFPTLREREVRRVARSLARTLTSAVQNSAVYRRP